MATLAPVERESVIIERLVVSPESARAILSLKFSAEDEERMRELIDKNNKGTITEAERIEMESYVRIGNFLGIIQAKARVFVKELSSDS